MLSSLFDTYSLKARVYPGLFVLSPVIIGLVLLWHGNTQWHAVAPVAVSACLSLLLGNVVRSKGYALEQRLTKEWGGLPTTQLLRHQHDGNTVLRDRRRSLLEQLFDVTLASRQQERRSPEKADEQYVAATRRLILCVRGRKQDFPLVHEENANYGFRRNLLGMKMWGIGLALLALTVDAIIIWRTTIPTLSVVGVAAVHIAILMVWVIFVRRSWVLQAGNIYAERLFEALEQMERERTVPPD